MGGYDTQKADSTAWEQLRMRSQAEAYFFVDSCEGVWAIFADCGIVNGLVVCRPTCALISSECATGDDLAVDSVADFDEAAILEPVSDPILRRGGLPPSKSTRVTTNKINMGLQVAKKCRGLIDRLLPNGPTGEQQHEM